MRLNNSFLEGFLKGRFSIMLIAFATLFLVVPVLPESWSAARVSEVLNMVVLVSCMRALSLRRYFLYFMIGYTVVLVLLDSAALFGHIELNWFTSMVLSLKLAYLLLVFVSIMRHVLGNTLVTSDTVYGALSAYFLMGFAWAIGFTLFFHINPDSFNVPADADSTWATYFSFTTLTTLGYGDISPQSVPARAYSIMEAACGQIFLAVIVARLIALQIMAGAGKKD